jgi:DNA segregation ATPase FtsK/SpoIIIE, S-DNA-T family
MAQPTTPPPRNTPRQPNEGSDSNRKPRPNTPRTDKPTNRANTPTDRPTRPTTARTGRSASLGLVLARIGADERYRVVGGMALLVLGACLWLAFGSYMWSGHADQSLPDESAGEARNYLGRLGALVGQIFMFRWFGLGALGLPLVLVLAGGKLAFGREWLPLGRTTWAVLFGAVWTSLFLGYIVRLTGSVSTGSVWCGGIGYELNNLLYSLLGWGSIVFIGLLLFGFVVFFFNITSLAQVFPARTAEEADDLEDADDTEPTDTAEPADNRPRNTFVNPASAEINPASEPIVATEPTENLTITPPATGVTAQLPFTATTGKPARNNTPNEPLTLTVIDAPGDVADTTDTDPDALNLIAPPPPAIAPTFDIEPLVTDEDDLLAKLGPYDPTLDLAHYRYPTTDLLTVYPDNQKAQVSADELRANQDKIVDTLYQFNIGIKQIFATIGPTVTLYEIIPADGVRISKIKNLEDDIALSLAALGIRIIAPMPGKGTIGIEVPNKHREMVSIRSVVASEKFAKFGGDLPVIVGKTISNEILVVDLAKMPHLLMAGATGQGKSVGLNVLLTSLLYKKHPAQLKLVLVDPKKVELTLFNRIERHFLAKLPDEAEAIITDTKKVVNTLNSLCIEMDNRYNLLKEGGVRNLKEYNAKFTQRKLNPEKGHRYLPYIVLVIDELADLMMTAGKEVEQPIARLAQLARAIGIHLVVATQRPSVNVITGLIKANFPARLSFKVTSSIDSRTILDAAGADQLVGMGDMLLSMNSDVIRLQCPFVDTAEIEAICAFIGDQRGYSDAYLLPESADDAGGQSGDDSDADLGPRDPMFAEAARLIVMHQQGSTSLIQRRLKLGYNRSGRIIDQLEAAGIVGPFEGSKAREVLYHDLPSLEEKLKNIV